MIADKSVMVPKLPILAEAPTGDITVYDRDHAVVYLRLLDAEAAGAAWREVAQIVLGLDEGVQEETARHIYDSHLIRAHWLKQGGYAELLNLPYDATRDGPTPGSR